MSVMIIFLYFYIGFWFVGPPMAAEKNGDLLRKQRTPLWVIIFLFFFWPTAIAVVGWKHFLAVMTRSINYSKGQKY